MEGMEDTMIFITIRTHLPNRTQYTSVVRGCMLSSVGESGSHMGPGTRHHYSLRADKFSLCTGTPNDRKSRDDHTNLKD